MTIHLKIDKTLKKVAKNIASNQKYKPNLHTLFLKDNSIYATNGFKLMKIKYKDTIFPDNNIDATEAIENEGVDTTKFSKKEVPDIDFEKFLKVDTDVQIGFNVDYLIKILEVYKSAWIKDAVLQINSLNRHDAIRIVNYRSNEEIDITTVLMPLNIY